MSAWRPEVVVAPEMAAALIAEQFPALAPVTLAPLGTGFDNTAYLVNDRVVFRFPRRAVAVPLLETEARALPAIAPGVPAPVPVPAYLGVPRPGYPWPFLGHALLSGRTLCAARLGDAGRAALAAPLGSFLRALHALPIPAPADTIRRLDLDWRLARARESLGGAVARGWIAEGGALAALLERAPRGWMPRADTLVHGDLHVRHVLVDDAGALAGIIDWGDLHRGDAAIDLAIAHTVLPAAAHPAFRAAYGAIDETAWRVARLRALWHTLLVLSYAHETDDLDLLREAGWTLRTLAESAHGE